MKNIYAHVGKGWIVSNVYPAIHLYMEGTPGKITNADVAHFISSQPDTVKDLLYWESQKYKNYGSFRDPLSKDYIKTPHADINYIRPKSWRKASGRIPVFFSCPQCNGRLFWGMPMCGWCGSSVTKDLDVGTNDGAANTFLNLVDYLFPTNSRPMMSTALAALQDDDAEFLTDDPINIHDLRQVLKNIEDYIPTVAYAPDSAPTSKGLIRKKGKKRSKSM